MKIRANRLWFLSWDGYEEESRRKTEYYFANIFFLISHLFVKMITNKYKEMVRDAVVSSIESQGPGGVATHYDIVFNRLSEVFDRRLEEKSRKSKGNVYGHHTKHETIMMI